MFSIIKALTLANRRRIRLWCFGLFGMSSEPTGAGVDGPLVIRAYREEGGARTWNSPPTYTRSILQVARAPVYRLVCWWGDQIPYLMLLYAMLCYSLVCYGMSPRPAALISTIYTIWPGNAWGWETLYITWWIICHGHVFHSPFHPLPSLSLHCSAVSMQ